MDKIQSAFRVNVSDTVLIPFSARIVHFSGSMKVPIPPGWCSSVIERRPVNQRVAVRFPVREHAWVAGQVPSRGSVRGNHTLMFLSLFLKINK